jgi:type IV fimbrial biogenesis protein FimT
MAQARARQTGLTLVEILVALAVALTLMFLVAPLFNNLVTSNSNTTSDNLLRTHYQLARSETVKHNSVVSLCPSADASSCSGGTDWSVGWISFLDTNNNGDRDGGETILLVQDGSRAGSVVDCDWAFLRWLSDATASPPAGADPATCPVISP